jgi:hypothetical protein
MRDIDTNLKKAKFCLRTVFTKAEARVKILEADLATPVFAQDIFQLHCQGMFAPCTIRITKLNESQAVAYEVYVSQSIRFPTADLCDRKYFNPKTIVVKAP